MGKSKYDFLFTEEEKKQMVNEYESGLSIKDLCEKYQIKNKSWVVSNILNGRARNLSEAMRVAHKKCPKSFKHTEETKQKIREKHIKWMEEHPDKTPWGKRRNPSYPESCFIKYLVDRGYDKKYEIIREHPFYGYSIDFAFVNEKIAVEIDGSQHLLKEREESDKRKDEALKERGWKIIRISQDKAITGWTEIDQALPEILSGIKHSDYTRVGIVRKIKGEERVSRSGKKYIYYYRPRIKTGHKRKVKNRPSKEELYSLITNCSFRGIGRMYGVTDNAVKKWCKDYGIPSKKKEILKNNKN